MATNEPSQHAPPLITPEDSPTDRPSKPLIRRACDCCRKRKIKCDGNDPCSPCRKAAIRCGWLERPRKKGPRGLRSERVLHALRRIDDSLEGTSTELLTPQQQGQFGNWAWGREGHMQYTDAGPGSAHATRVPGAPGNIAPDQTYYQQMPTSTSYGTSAGVPYPYRHEPPPQSWPPHAESFTTSSDHLNSKSRQTSDSCPTRLPNEIFLPYVQLFFEHMFPIMPILEHSFYLDPNFYHESNQLSSETYVLMCSLCAAVLVQLDASTPQPPPMHPHKRTDDIFASEATRVRRDLDYMEDSSTLSVMASFFLFAYYGNHEKHGKAWYYLQESITFSEILNMDDESSYSDLDPVEAQWRRRLYWLLFVTERAYAVQRRKHTRLHASVQLPLVFESEDPQLLNGFVNLVNLFSAVDDSFVAAWRGSRRASLCDETWLKATQQQLDAAALAMENMTETQHLDISVTREWLHVLAWQMGVSNGLIWGKGEGGMRLDYPIELARKVVEITTTANAVALDSHGIGMEQKLSDIAGCLADVLKCTAGDTSATFLEGKQYLSILLTQLSSMRGKESRYLKPLMSKMEGLIGYDLNPQPPPPTSTTQSIDPVAAAAGLRVPGERGMSVSLQGMQDGMEMLRSLSMSGNLGMPPISPAPLPTMAVGQGGNWGRRASGRVYNEEETAWLEERR